MVFSNRNEAGQKLAAALKGLTLVNPIVIGLPRGGVPVAAEVATELNIPLDVLVVRKIGSPDNPELGIGAITEEGPYWVSKQSIQALGVTEEEIKTSAEIARNEVYARIKAIRGSRPLMPVDNHDVILVDDGIATGVTTLVAIRYLKKLGAKKVILATPVGSRSTINFLQTQTDEVICLEKPDLFFSVGQWYEDFSQLSDEDVIEILSRVSITQQVPQQPSSLQTLGAMNSEEVNITDGELNLPAQLTLPKECKGVVIFAKELEKSRLSNQIYRIHKGFQQLGLGTLTFSLLTESEAEEKSNRFEVPILSSRFVLATRWIQDWLIKSSRNIQEGIMPIGYFGSGISAAAALMAAAELGPEISCVVSIAGKVDLSIHYLNDGISPTLLLVGGNDELNLKVNEEALKSLRVGNLVVLRNTSLLNDDSKSEGLSPGIAEEVGQHASSWFVKYFVSEIEKKAA